MAETTESALIIGAGSGLSASIARLCAGDGMRLCLAARDTDKLSGLAQETGAARVACDVSDPVSVASAFREAEATIGVPDLVVFNPSARQRGPLVDLDPEAVRAALLVTCHGGFLVGQQAARAMLPRGSGTILFTGASASVKGYPQSASFAMGKFGLRGLAQSMAREFAPKGLHVGHVIIDGAIRSTANPDDGTDRLLDPDAIAQAYLMLHRQHRSAWTWEVEVRPWTESF